VVVEAVIGKQGDVLSAKVIEGDKIFWDAALTAVKRWKFQPLTSQEQQVGKIKMQMYPQNQTNPAPDSQKAVSPESQLEVIHREPPIYPPQAKAKGISGTVVVEAVIGKQGDVLSARVIEGDKIFWDAALTAVKRWKFQPLTSQEQQVGKIKMHWEP
jgi:TonB family protein